MDNAIKSVELWRVNGKFAKAPTPAAIEVEVPEVNPKERGSVIIATAMAGMSTGLFAIVFWRITFAVVATLVLAYYANKFLKDQKEKGSRQKLVVNQGRKSSVVYL